MWVFNKVLMGFKDNEVSNINIFSLFLNFSFRANFLQINRNVKDLPLPLLYNDYDRYSFLSNVCLLVFVKKKDALVLVRKQDQIN